MAMNRFERLKGEGSAAELGVDRAEVLAALACVDYVTIFPEVRATQFLARSGPAIYVKGGDYKRGNARRGGAQRASRDRRGNQDHSIRRRVLDVGDSSSPNE